MPYYQAHVSGHLTVPLSEHDHYQGRLSAPLQLVEYGDFQCPYCRMADAAVKQIQAEFGDQLCYAFRNFPLIEIHPYALIAAQAAESAGLLGKYWEMHDILFANQPAFEPEELVQYAIAIGLDPDAFVADMEDERIKRRIETDLKTGRASGVNGTPSFYINNKKYEGDTSESGLQMALLAAT